MERGVSFKLLGSVAGRSHSIEGNSPLLRIRRIL